MGTQTEKDVAVGRLEKESIWEVYYPRGVREDKEAIPLASFPVIFYFWPSMLSFLGFGLLQALGWVAPTTVGWWVYGTFALNLIVIVHELDQKKLLILVLSLGVVGLLLWVSNLYGLPLLAGAAGAVRALDPTFSTDALLLIGLTLLLFFLVGLAQPRFDYWRIEPNEFVHYIQPWGRDQSIPRDGSTVTREVPDVLELLLTFGGGTLVIRREGQVVARIDHVPFLGKRMIAIERMLGATRVRQVDQ
jgi:hypothetical protein